MRDTGRHLACNPVKLLCKKKSVDFYLCFLALARCPLWETRFWPRIRGELAEIASVVYTCLYFRVGFFFFTVSHPHLLRKSVGGGIKKKKKKVRASPFSLRKIDIQNQSMEKRHSFRFHTPRGSCGNKNCVWRPAAQFSARISHLQPKMSQKIRTFFFLPTLDLEEKCGRLDEKQEKKNHPYSHVSLSPRGWPKIGHFVLKWLKSQFIVLN